jgi:hypothetical protein
MSAAKSRLRGGQQSVTEAAQFLKKNNAIFNRHKGERCFVLGAGSSIAKQDLRKLAGECVISVSNTFVHPDYPVFKPRYHVLPPILQGHGVLYTQEKFVGWLREMDQKTLNAEMFFHIGDKDLIDSNGLFKNRIIHWNEYCVWDGTCDFPLDLANVPSVGSVSEFAITVALYLGFDEVYLLGFDHDWFNGPMVFFYDHKTQHAMAPDEKLIPQVDSEFQMRRHADMFKKYKCLYQLKKNIYNANADAKTYVDTFPRVNYESLFND